MDVSYQQQAPAIWQTLMLAVALGGSVMAAALLVFAGGIAASLLPERQPEWCKQQSGCGMGCYGHKSRYHRLGRSHFHLGDRRCHVRFSALGFELMQSLPISASGGGGH
jgi:hypothetical protein